jgi:allophanate hydrolase
MKIPMNIAAILTSYRQGELSPRSLINQCRESALNDSQFNAWIYVLSEEELEPYLSALEEKTIDELPLYGIPFAIKDNIDLANIPTSAACPDFSYTPDISASVVDQLIQAGAIPIGKTNLDQFATGLVGTRSPYGEGKNSFNPDYISGGSSAGSAIATALGHVSFALGTDTAGSGRVPAALNNLIGLKPSKGLLSTRGVVPACRTLDCVSVFSLNASDAALILKHAAKFDPDDPFSRENPYNNQLRFFDSAETFHFAVPEQLDFQGDTECEAIFKQSISALEALGGKKTEIDFSDFLKAARLLYEGPWVAERVIATESVASESMNPVVRDIIKGAKPASASDLFNAQYQLQACKQKCDALVKAFDFIVTPTCPTLYTRAQIQEDPIRLNSILGTYTNFMNLLDFSAVAVPSAITERGPSWGITFFSQAFSDIKLLSIAEKFQQRMQLPLGASQFPLGADTHLAAQAYSDKVRVAVCGAHLQGQPLNWQLAERGARLINSTKSSEHYRLFALSDGKRPGMQRVDSDGKKIEIEVWELPTLHFGSFVAAIPQPLGIGKVELESGEWVSGFICEDYGLEDAKDITEFGAWRNWLQHLQSADKGA